MTTLEKTINAATADQIAAVLDQVTKRFGVSLVELRGDRKHRHIAHSRHVAAWLLRDLGLTLEEVGKLLCRNHTTIRHSVRRVERERESSRSVAETLDGLRGAA